MNHRNQSEERVSTFNNVNYRISCVRHKFHFEVIRSRAASQSNNLPVGGIWLHHRTCYPCYPLSWALEKDYLSLSLKH